jgi:hypothetical protein
MKKMLAVMFCAAGLWVQGSQAPPKETESVWTPLQFLIGTWEAKTEGGSAGAVGSGAYDFQLELKKHVLVRRAAGAECKGPADFNCEHTDLLFVYQDAPGKPLRAIFFDNEGHVIHYDVSAPEPGKAVFLSDASQAGPQYRLSYALKGGTLSGKFEMRLPGQPDFTTYLAWSGWRK